MSENTPDLDPERARLEEQRERKRLSREKYRAADPERARRQKHESRRRSRVRARAEEARRASDRERAKAWAADNPERVRERQRKWNAQNPDRVREHKRNYYHRNREGRQAAGRDQNARRRQDPDEREKARQYQAQHREHRNTQQNVRRSDPEIREKHNREQNERRRRERRRRKLGLPPRPMHKATTNERARNAAAADEFFSRKRASRDLHTMQGELAEVRAAAALSSDAHWRAGLAARILADAAEPARIAAKVDHHLRTRDGAALREEVRLDSIARNLRGAGHYPNAEAEVRRRAASVLEARQKKLTQSPRSTTRPLSPGLDLSRN